MRVMFNSRINLTRWMTLVGAGYAWLYGAPYRPGAPRRWAEDVPYTPGPEIYPNG